MVFRSNRSGFDELWIAGADGSRPWQATRYRGTFVGDPHWSPDGLAVAFTSHADGNPDIYLMRCELNTEACSEPRQLTRIPAVDANPTWSNDGRWIYFSSSRNGPYEVWRMPADGGEAERITWNGGYLARESGRQWFTAAHDESRDRHGAPLVAERDADRIHFGAQRIAQGLHDERRWPSADRSADGVQPG